MSEHTMTRPSTRPAQWAVLAVLAVAALMILNALITGAHPASLTQAVVAGLTLINGPLVDGPLLDLGGLLNGLQLGQFQQ
ncbi:hypothetical protein GCM10010977_02290 [Citricoccus zhacaiensis]|uniref:ABC transporter permease n=1 Tax=Citricoccus zhacaiensis TaxID=489142 RepID=A0ABQ2LMJ5_9MICC|nr:hypothetical protein [Citricoccus zhacaiensis]GGO40279.1 hypothetical protein GCM10010977_02290 [Citricoccus zhacaiensis]